MWRSPAQASVGQHLCLLWAWVCIADHLAPANMMASSRPRSGPSERGFEKAGGNDPGVTACWWLSSSRSPGQGRGMHTTAPGSWKPGQLGPGLGSGAGAGGVLSGSTPARCWPSAPPPSSHRRWLLTASRASCACCLGPCGPETQTSCQETRCRLQTGYLYWTIIMAPEGIWIYPKAKASALGTPSWSLA